MTITVIGTPKSGKSEKAEAIACSISQEDSRFYIATMIPYGEEGKKRVAKHRLMREGKGFVTIEQPLDIPEALKKISQPEQATVLLECISNLSANEMFERRCEDVHFLAAKITEDVKCIQEAVKNLVVVSNRFDEAEGSDDETVRYIRLMQEINKNLLELSDRSELL